jgi:hypothetical protein
MFASKPLLTDDQVASFTRDGYLLLPNFYDLTGEIEPIQRGVHAIIGIIIKKYDLSFKQLPFKPESFDACYQDIIAYDRKIGGEIYDAVKQIPAFVRLTCSEKHDALLCQLRNSTLPGVAAGGYGIRIDNPNEERFRADWHQDYPGQFRSLDGLVFWSPLVALTPDMGPVEVCVGSHKDGLVPLLSKDPDNPDKTGAYGLRLKDRDERIARYSRVAPLTKPGDLLILDFLVLHASGHNHSQRSRWTMQMRYFNFLEPTGIRIGWVGSFAAGKSINEVHPGLLRD